MKAKVVRVGGEAAPTARQPAWANTQKPALEKPLTQQPVNHRIDQHRMERVRLHKAAAKRIRSQLMRTNHRMQPTMTWIVLPTALASQEGGEWGEAMLQEGCLGEPLLPAALIAADRKWPKKNSSAAEVQALGTLGKSRGRP